MRKYLKHQYTDYVIQKELTMHGSHQKKTFLVKDHKGDLYVMKRKSYRATTKQQIEKYMNLYLEINHPNLVEGYQYLQIQQDSVKGSGKSIIILQYCDHDLSAIIGSDKLTIEQLIKKMIQISLGVKQLNQRHERIHRDIKPQKIMIKNGVAKISNFSLSRELVIQKMIKTYHDGSGSTFYMAPEMGNVDQKYYTAKIDIWSLGIVFLELISGKRLIDILVDQKTPPAQRGDFPKKAEMQHIQDQTLKKLVRSMLEKDPNNRPSIDQVLQVLLKKNVEIQKVPVPLEQEQKVVPLEQKLIVSQQLIKFINNCHYRKYPRLENSRQSFIIQYMNQQFVVKLKGYTSKSMKRALQELSQVYLRLDHPYILKTYQFKEVQECQFRVIMPYCPLGNLTQRLLKQQINLNEMKKIMIELCQAAEYIHSIGQVHRNIKAQNIYFKDGSIKLAKLLTSNAIRCSNETNQSMQERLYLCPESQLVNDYGWECDIWNLGLVFFQMFTKRRFFQDYTGRMSQIEQLGKDFPGKQVDIVKNIVMQNLIRKMIQINPKNRPTLKQVIDTIKKI